MVAIPKNAPPVFHLLAKPTGAICNLDCKYCFFLSKEELYPGSRFRMTGKLLEMYIQQLLEAIQVPEVNVAWQGGEPTLMGLDFFKRSVDYVQKYKKPRQQILYTIQTNGIQLDDDRIFLYLLAYIDGQFYDDFRNRGRYFQGPSF